MSRTGRRGLDEREAPALPVSRQCRLLSVSRASVYRRPALVSEEDCTIMALIDRQYLVRPNFGPGGGGGGRATPGLGANPKRGTPLSGPPGPVATSQRPNTRKAAPAPKVHPHPPWGR